MKLYIFTSYLSFMFNCSLDQTLKVLLRLFNMRNNRNLHKVTKIDPACLIKSKLSNLLLIASHVFPCDILLDIPLIYLIRKSSRFASQTLKLVISFRSRRPFFIGLTSNSSNRNTNILGLIKFD